MGDGNATLRFYYPLPVFGEKMSRQWPKFREDFQNLAPLVRAAYIDLQPSSMHDPGENDLSGWAIGERDFRNRFRIWYSKDEDMFKIQYNNGTEDVPAWNDALQIRQSDLRITATGPGGIAAPTGGFYTDIPRQLAVTQDFPLSTEWQFQHNLNSVPLLWDTFRSNNISIVPAKVDVGDPNIAYFYFNSPVAGKAMAVAGQARGTGINFTDGTNIYYNKLQLDVSGQDFYLSRDLQGHPVLNLQPININNFDTSGLVKTDGSNPFVANQSMGGHLLTNVGTPVSAGDAVNKSYADSLPPEVSLTNGVGPLFSNVSKITFRQEDFYLDTDSSGQPVVNIRGGTGGGGSSGQFGTGIFAQDFSSSNEWVLTHNLGVSNILWDVYDDQGMAVIPNKVSVHNSNVAYFYFNPATAGRAVVGGGPIFQSSSSGSLTIQETDGNPPAFSAATKLTFNSNDFYLASDSSGQPVVNFRGSSGGSVTDDGTFIRADGTRRYTGTQLGSIHVERVVVADAFYLTPGSGGEFSKDGNDVRISSKDGGVTINAASGIGVGNGQPVILNSGGAESSGRAGSVDLNGGSADSNSAGNINITGGDSNTGTGGSVNITAGGSNSGSTSGDVNITGGLAPSGNGGSIFITPGTGSTGNDGLVFIGKGIDPNGIIAVLDNVTCNARLISNVHDPADAQDVATKHYVDIRFSQFYSNLGTGTGLQNVVEDLTPQLGGDLDVNNKTITGTGDINVNGLAQVNIVAANDGSGHGGLSLQTGLAFYLNASAATVAISGGTSSTADGGSVSITGGTAVTGGAGGSIDILAGDSNSGAGGNITISPGPSVSGVSGQVLFGGDVNMQLFYIHNLAYPENPSDAATKKYVDNHSGGASGVTITDGTSTYASATTLGFSNQSFYVSRGTGGRPVVNQRGIILDDGVSSYPLPNNVGFSNQSFYLSQGTNGKPVVNLRGINFDDGISSYSNPINVGFSNQGFYLSRGTGGKPVVNLRGINFDDGTSTYANPINVGFSNQGFYLSQGTNGKPVVNLRGINLDDGVSTYANPINIGFSNQGFYLSQGTNGKPVVNQRGPNFDDGVSSYPLPNNVGFSNLGFYLSRGTGGKPVVNLRGLNIDDGVSTYANPINLGLSNQDFYLSRGTGGKPVVNLRQSLEPLSAYLDFASVGNTFLETWSEHTQIIEDISLVCRAGSATAGFYIVPAAHPDFRDGTKVTGADPINISSTPSQTIPTGNKTLSPGDGLKMSIYINGNAKGIRVKVRLRKQ